MGVGINGAQVVTLLTNFCFLLHFTMAYVNKPKALVIAKAYCLSVTTCIRHAPRIFHLGGGGADSETIYNLCLVLKTML